MIDSMWAVKENWNLNRKFGRYEQCISARDT